MRAGFDGLRPRLAHSAGSNLPVRLNDSPDRQPEPAPPGDVRDVAERGDHRDAGALFSIGEAARGAARERRRAASRPLSRRAPDIADRGMGDERDARRKARVCRIDLNLDPVKPAPSLSRRDRNPMVGAWLFPISSSACATAVRKSTSRRVGASAGSQAHDRPAERQLGKPLRPPADYRVGHRPVNRQAQMTPEPLERFLFLGRHPRTELDEFHRDTRIGFLPGFRRLERQIQRQRRSHRTPK